MINPFSLILSLSAWFPLDNRCQSGLQMALRSLGLLTNARGTKVCAIVE